MSLVRVAIVAALLAAWEALAASGWLFRDVVPSLTAIGQRRSRACSAAPISTPTSASRRREIGAALAIGGAAGLAVGILLGANRFLSQAFESLLLYLGPTPKIIFFPVMIMWFGVGAGSKIAMGALSCFFPIAHQRGRRECARSTACWSASGRAFARRRGRW